MNDLHTEDLLKLANREYQRNFDIRLSMRARQNSIFNLWLASLGAWMVARGEKLQARYTESLKTNQMDSVKPKTEKASRNMYYTI
ncbi:MAG: hypothetical protein AB1607_06455 [Chloroflexota bacterium]